MAKAPKRRGAVEVARSASLVYEAVADALNRAGDALNAPSAATLQAAYDAANWAESAAGESLARALEDAAVISEARATGLRIGYWLDLLSGRVLPEGSIHGEVPRVAKVILIPPDDAGFGLVVETLDGLARGLLARTSPGAEPSLLLAGDDGHTRSPGVDHGDDPILWLAARLRAAIDSRDRARYAR